MRFPEFTDEWNKYLFDDIAQYKKGPFGSALKKEIFVPESNDTIKIYEQQNAIKKDWKLGRYFISKDYFINHMQQFVVKAGDIIVSCAGTIGEMYELPQNAISGVFNQALMRVRVNTDLIDKNIFIEVFSSMINTFSKIYSNGSAIKNIPPFADLKRTVVFIPMKNEQEKISKFISLIDERIATQNKIIEKYESLIQAIIYKTKTNGISKGSWQKMELSKVLHERNEKNIDGRTICSVSVSQGVVNQVEYLGRSFAAQQTNHYNVVKYGDIVYTKSPTGDFPYGIIKRSDIEEDVAVSPLYGVYTPSNDNIGVILHFYFMKPSNAFNYLHPLIQKGAKNTINITNLRFLENFVPLPISENEAYTIATTLKTIQKKIDIEKRLLQAYMIEKEYLLRQMFI
ncbi:restriction endonuclease subunit S [Bacteroides sp.]|uniref:restriction endonuclease subunit S n=2 Tax=Bacteroidales TaxID=171549 RepID=UPI002584C49D|nr:restriction endonuclease subunit S [Bacteroides sp.]